VEISVTDVVCFGEDRGHQAVIGSILSRIAAEEGVTVTIDWRVARRGHGAVTNELKSLLGDLQRERGDFPSLIVVATDANCVGYNARRGEITSLTDRVPNLRVVCAIPDPHVERWLLLDSAAFKSVLGVGCDAPDQKCERDRYKSALRSAIRGAGFTPEAGGIEYAEDIVNAMNLDRSGRQDTSLGRFLDETRLIFREWRDKA
jgi:hypothetical protein